MFRVLVTAFVLAAGPALPVVAAEPASSLDTAAIDAAASSKKLRHYGAQVLRSVAAIAIEDHASGGAVTLSDSTLKTLRIALGRFVEGCDDIGLDSAETAALLDRHFAEMYRGLVPEALQSEDGGLNSKALVDSAVAARLSESATDEDKRYVQMVQMEGQIARAGNVEVGADVMAVTELAPDPVDAPAPLPDLASIDPDAPPEVKEVLSRIVDEDGRRSIVITKGDTLGLIARAVFGDTLRYREIYDWNAALLSSPDALKVGITLNLPPA